MTALALTLILANMFVAGGLATVTVLHIADGTGPKFNVVFFCLANAALAIIQAVRLP